MDGIWPTGESPGGPEAEVTGAIGLETDTGQTAAGAEAASSPSDSSGDGTTGAEAAPLPEAAEVRRGLASPTPRPAVRAGKARQGTSRPD